MVPCLGSVSVSWLEDVISLFSLRGVFHFWKLCLGKREQGTPLCLFIPGIICAMGLLPAWRAAVLSWERLRCRAAPLSSNREGNGEQPHSPAPAWRALIPREAEGVMKRIEVYPCLPPSMFTWEWQYCLRPCALDLAHLLHLCFCCCSI